MRYFNATKGPLSLSLLSGTTLHIGSKSFGYVSGTDQSSPALRRAVEKGYLNASAELAPRVEPLPVEAVEVVEEVAPKPEPIEAPEPALGSGITEFSESSRRRRK